MAHLRTSGSLAAFELLDLVSEKTDVKKSTSLPLNLHKRKVQFSGLTLFRPIEELPISDNETIVLDTVNTYLAKILLAVLYLGAILVVSILCGFVALYFIQSSNIPKQPLLSPYTFTSSFNPSMRTTDIKPEVLMSKFPNQPDTTWHSLYLAIDPFLSPVAPGQNSIMFMVYSNMNEQNTADCLADQVATLVRDIQSSSTYTVIDTRRFVADHVDLKSLNAKLQDALRNVTSDNQVVILRGFEKLPSEIATACVQTMAAGKEGQSILYIIESQVNEIQKEEQTNFLQYKIYSSLPGVMHGILQAINNLPHKLTEASRFLENYVVVSAEPMNDLLKICPQLNIS